MKCSLPVCKKKQSIIGECKYCKKKFCSFHRLQEDHRCERLNESNEQRKRTLSDSLVSEKTTDNKGLVKF